MNSSGNTKKSWPPHTFERRLALLTKLDTPDDKHLPWNKGKSNGQCMWKQWCSRHGPFRRLLAGRKEAELYRNLCRPKHHKLVKGYGLPFQAIGVLHLGAITGGVSVLSASIDRYRTRQQAAVTERRQLRRQQYYKCLGATPTTADSGHREDAQPPLQATGCDCGDLSSRSGALGAGNSGRTACAWAGARQNQQPKAGQILQLVSKAIHLLALDEHLGTARIACVVRGKSSFESALVQDLVPDRSRSKGPLCPTPGESHRRHSASQTDAVAIHLELNW